MYNMTKESIDKIRNREKVTHFFPNWNGRASVRPT